MSAEEYELPITTSTTPKRPRKPSLTEDILPKQMRLVDLTVTIPSSSRTTSLPNEEAKNPSRWRTAEFQFYYIVAAIVIPIMIWIPVTLSSPSHPNYPFYKGRLSQGWILGRPIDNSDAQYRSFRNNIPILTVVATILFLAKWIWTRAHAVTARIVQDNLHLLPFNLFCSLLFLSGLHGTSIIKILGILTINFTIAKVCKASRLGPILTWVFNGMVLFMNDRYNGYRFGDVLPSLEILDAFEGFHPRWHISFNITMLRLVSFNMDYYWRCRGVGSTETGSHLNERQRLNVPHPDDMYNSINYLAYALYSPLYIAGPIMTFNDFLWQFRQPQQITRSTILRYLVRFLASLLTMEFILHFMYVVAIKDRKAWMGDTPTEISMIGFWNLVIVWLKLLIPWRFFRLWALADGIDAPENMVRCVANNYSTFGFWRSWHRSYNLWIIRYIYIPLGGVRNVFVNSVLVFTFVALWHDLTFKLLAWGWLVSLFILPEMLARFLLPASRYGAKPWYRHACAVGAVLNILLMMIANLVGFVIGTDGIQFFVDQLFGTISGLKFLVGAVCCLFVGAQLMFEYREEEMRNGIYRRC
ncbi:glycerol transporter [Moniliophthora roreri MCA 2997]|uniref:Glycerol transporter n=1 Tax=Moniliophthora roreri (strain MCA 2997) TaxID=1381753 RepID=V2XUA8_MONRO|nr:glycerol transporter [Moniliophthora roreri MCA 2997]